jgi:predicted nucleotidyltransferase
MLGLSVDRDGLETLCREYHVIRLSVFGSRLRGDSTDKSDLDLLVEFAPGMTPGLKFFKLERELSRLFGVKVDLNTAGFLSPYFRADVTSNATPIYAV